MQDNLDKLKSEIERKLETDRFIVFRGLARSWEDSDIVYWQTEKYPDYNDFLQTAEAVGIRLIVLAITEFHESAGEDMEDRLETASFPRDERRAAEKSIKDLKTRVGAICTIELSYTFDNQIYMYEVKPPWFEEYEDMIDNLMMADGPFQMDESDDTPMGGFFSKN